MNVFLITFLYSHNTRIRLSLAVQACRPLRNGIIVLWIMVLVLGIGIVHDHAYRIFISVLPMPMVTRLRFTSTRDSRVKAVSFLSA